ncbi:MAG: glutamine amidotransferase family protein [Proteobacteria bacterium]|nr:glutamine amidotransferase family protein [Pseudomonadota bacterium]MDE3208467.1 glutamine amidotransferase family protein [Pseudomonadota bacterium]
MCGIVGLLVKNPAMRDELGKLMLPMLIGMTERGPDSAGLAVFGDKLAKGKIKFNLFTLSSEFDWKAFEKAFDHHFGSHAELNIKGRHAILLTSVQWESVREWLVQDYRHQLTILCVGNSMDIYKDIGTPEQVANRYDFSKLHGTHLVGHTRMATESAVTPQHAHPFTAGHDFCLVHNGSLSNPYSIRKKLEPLGIRFVTDNDTEAACRFLEWRMREGDTLEEALKAGFEELDGFYTFLIGTEDKLALVRDPFACKPAVVAENDDYVAISSEFRSLARLPDIKNARLFEPAPEELYVWTI